MGGGLMQLVAYGAQDIYLTGNPQITFFKVVYRRHTNFSMETIQQTLNGTQVNVANGGTATCTISRNGDLVYKTYVSFAAASGDTNGSKLVKQVELEIGGQRIDRHYQEWNEVWNELSTPESKAVGLKAMQLEIGTGSGSGVTECHIPLNFWFCRNPGLALPLIALQYHEVKLKFTWDDPGSNNADPKVWCDYIYLDTDERRRFAQVSHEYLIEQVQLEEKTLTANASETHKLNFNHPVKELIWTYGSSNRLTDVKIQLNGHDRFAAQPDEYFSLKQPLDYHTAIPRQNLPSAAQLTSNYTTVGTNLVGTLTSEADRATTGSDGDVSADSKLHVSLFASRTDDTTTAFANTATVTNTGYAVTDAIGTTTKFIVGRVYQITFGGGAKDAAANGASITSTLTHRLEGAAAGDGSGVEVVAGTTVLFFDKLLVSAAAVTANAAVAAGEVIISGISLITPDSTLVTQARTSQMIRNIGVYSFALKPEEHQPSGTCNFSRIDNAQLIATNSDFSTDTSLKIYAVNYNVLRIMSGMGGLAYSN
jgi:hypothetical protein